ncbi:MAG TPA: SDR family oxidoreductase [Acidimicrobiia bacterium]|nr:SDR family oxidoreductase [Acidimicrobiia bacterium]
MSRVVVVGGGGTGIGRSIAQSFALDGEQVVIVGRRLDTLAGAATEIGDKAGAPVETISADLADPGQVDQLRQWVAERYGRVDVLVNAAGGNVDIGAKPPEIRGSARVAWSWQGNFRANVLTAVLLTEALRDLLASPGGRVVLISSIAAYRGSGTGSYAASKAALHPYAYDLAAALGSRDVTVNTVAPGYIEGTEFFGRGLPTERRQALVDETKVKRAGTPEDVAAAVRWLASPEARHVTGQIIQVNGGAERGR